MERQHDDFFQSSDRFNFSLLSCNIGAPGSRVQGAWGSGAGKRGRRQAGRVERCPRVVLVVERLCWGSWGTCCAARLGKCGRDGCSYRPAAIDLRQGAQRGTHGGAVSEGQLHINCRSPAKLYPMHAIDRVDAIITGSGQKHCINPSARNNPSARTGSPHMKGLPHITTLKKRKYKYGVWRIAMYW